MTDSLSTPRAWCRAIPDTFDRAVVQAPRAEPIRVDVARRQHQAYVQTLQSLGLAVTVLPADERFPDCCFVEDCAVLVEGTVLITRLGVASRRGEEAAIAAAIEPVARVETTAAPATLEGGDCLRMGRRLFVGRSQRTNAAGVQRLRQIFEPLGMEVVEVPLGDVLHLKCVCARLDDNTMQLAEGTIAREVFGGIDVVPVPAAEAYAANALCVNGTVLLPAGFPATCRAVAAAGFRVQELDMSEIRKADGSMTCLSILY